MKRSDMVEVLRNSLLDRVLEEGMYIPVGTVSLILTDLEVAGMQPKGYNKYIGPTSEPGVDNYIRVNDWEPEAED